MERNETLRLALTVALTETRKHILEASAHIRKLHNIFDNRHFGDGYISQEGLLQVIANWEDTQGGWVAQEQELLKLIVRLTDAGEI